MTGRRIAVVTDSFPPNWGGGIASSHYHLACYLRSSGNDVRVFALYDRSSPIPVDDIKTERSAPPRWLDRLIRRGLPRLFALLDCGKSAYQTADIFLRAFGAIRLRSKLRRFEPQIVVFPDHGAAAFFLKRMGQERRVLIAHHNSSRFLDLPFLEPHSRLDVRLAQWFESRSLCSIDSVICPSSYMEGVFKSSFPHFSGSISVCHNIVNQSWIDSIPAAPLSKTMQMPAGTPIILFPAGGNKFKGGIQILSILDGLSNCARSKIGVCITGAVSEPLRSQLQSAANDHLSIFLPGAVDGPTNVAIVKACDIAVSPSLAENFSMALLECVLCGVPVLAYDVGGNSELVLQGVNGFTVSCGEVEELIGQIEALLVPTARKELSASTQADAKRRLSSVISGPKLLRAVLGEA